jgi:hypothetical protein
MTKIHTNLTAAAAIGRQSMGEKKRDRVPNGAREVVIERGRGARGCGDEGTAAGGGTRDQMWWRWNMGRWGAMEQSLEMKEGKASETWPLPSTLDGAVPHGNRRCSLCSSTPRPLCACSGA